MGVPPSSHYTNWNVDSLMTRSYMYVIIRGTTLHKLTIYKIQRAKCLYHTWSLQLYFSVCTLQSFVMKLMAISFLKDCAIGRTQMANLKIERKLVIMTIHYVVSFRCIFSTHTYSHVHTCTHTHTTHTQHTHTYIHTHVPYPRMHQPTHAHTTHGHVLTHAHTHAPHTSM